MLYSGYSITQVENKIGFNEGIGVATLREKQADEVIDKARSEI